MGLPLCRAEKDMEYLHQNGSARLTSVRASERARKRLGGHTGERAPLLGNVAISREDGRSCAAAAVLTQPHTLVEKQPFKTMSTAALLNTLVEMNSYKRATERLCGQTGERALYPHLRGEKGNRNPPTISSSSEVGERNALDHATTEHKTRGVKKTSFHHHARAGTARATVLSLPGSPPFLPTPLLCAHAHTSQKPRRWHCEAHSSIQRLLYLFHKLEDGY
uniref:(California timema) hypothetical protein n=1 Tax=Timema californicum TaxID=61474 RepID=A0A7R9J2Y6_TIMCA|nr:unnamed protein product [Timema californicum]